MSDEVVIEYVTGLVDGLVIDAIVVAAGRSFQASIDLHGRFNISSDDEKTIPVFIVYEVYRSMYLRALEMRVGKVDADHEKQTLDFRSASPAYKTVWREMSDKKQFGGQ